jgi:hypothetical protein
MNRKNPGDVLMREMVKCHSLACDVAFSLDKSDATASRAQEPLRMIRERDPKVVKQASRFLILKK